MLSDAIDLLSERTGLATSLLDVSNHGGSPGEGGLYLHGAPYVAAREPQTRVPMILWMSGIFVAREGIGRGCIGVGAVAPPNHDNLFHSVPGVLDVETELREPALGPFAGCPMPPTLARL